MATSKPAAKAAVDGGKKSKSKLFVIIGAALALAAAGGGGAWYFLGHKKDGGEQEEAHASSTSKPKGKVKASAPPVFLPMDPYTVNLQPGENGDQYLQTTITLQLEGAEDAETVKVYLPQVRSQILLLLSGKRGAELSTVEGKKKLSGEIMALFAQPFSRGGPAIGVTDVMFTAFVIQ
jgi:flagellar FliL protein